MIFFQPAALVIEFENKQKKNVQINRVKVQSKEVNVTFPDFKAQHFLSQLNIINCYKNELVLSKLLCL